MKVEISKKAASDFFSDLSDIGYNTSYFRGTDIVLREDPRNKPSVFVELGMQIQKFGTNVANPWIVLTSYALTSL